GDYLEVVDIDPASDCAYAPVDLNHPYLLAQDGLVPSQGNPQFHQQMVYAVAMTTIRNFERALGRRVLWSQADEEQGYGYIQRLRIYPHAMREANAYYSPQKKALLFGYFPASTTDPGSNLPGGTVFTCLSHDIVAHETTHALLDGLHRRFIEPSNGDTLALHEGFADIVALFQHFSSPAALRDQIRRTRGDLAGQNLLGQLAQQFGQAIGNYGALRDALGETDEVTRKWRPRDPDPADLQKAHEPHERGAILVAAVFDAFLTIYKSRIADLLRIATSGTGVLPQGDLHPDLVERLAREASASAGHVLSMCIRALDHCPPVDVNFGDYLRALVTADRDLVPDDDRGYRIAVIEAFRRRGIYPQGVRSLSAESLCWAGPMGPDEDALRRLLPGVKSLQELRPDWSLSTPRKTAWEEMRKSARAIHTWLQSAKARDLAMHFGLALGANAPRSIPRDRSGRPLFEVHSVRPARRLGPDGQTLTDLVIEITQKRHAYLNRRIQEQVDQGKIEPPPHDFWFRGGCTILIDLDHGEVRYCIGKGIARDPRLAAQREFVRSVGSLSATYFGGPRRREPAEPFALLHRSL
ncbi:MAG: peptidase S8, partial [Thermoanaerobaculia bacterium]